MADVATPSAVAMSTVNAGSESNDNTSSTRPSTKPEKPEKPDKEAFEKEDARQQRQFDEAVKERGRLQEAFYASRDNRNSPQAQRQDELKKEMQEIKDKQATNKNSKTDIMSRVTELDKKLKAKIADQKASREKLPYKSIADMEAHCQRLQAEVDKGTMRIADEKKNLDNISKARRTKPQFAKVDDLQKDIDSLKQQISDTKKEADNPETKALSKTYDEKKAELDKLYAETKAARGDKDAKRAAWEKQKAVVDDLFKQRKALKDDYFPKKKAFDNWEREAKKQQYERKKQERQAFELEKRKRDMADKLETASAAAYANEIHACDSLIRLFDPTSAPAEKAPLLSSKFAAAPGRQVEAGEMKGTALKKKGDDEESYFIGTGGKKGKKGKKTRTEEGGDMGIFYSPGVAEHFETIKIKQPADKDDKPRVLEQIKEKKKFYLDDQDRKTKENIAEAQKDLDRLDAGTTGTAPRTNGMSATTGPSASTAEESIVKSDPEKADGVASTTKAFEETGINESAVGSV